MTNKPNEFLKVLIVDDEAGMCLGASRALSNTQVFIDDLKTSVGFVSITALSGAEYKSKIEDNEFDLILLDYKLPDASGLDILQELNENHPDTLVIMMTAYATFETAVQATKLGAYDFLAKPFTPEELRNSVRKAATRFVLARHAKKFEEEKRKIRFEFISVLSHELKSPINAIDGYLKLLDDGGIAPGSDSYKMAIGRSISRLEGMRKLIFDLLDLTRIESGQKARNITDVDLSETIENSIELYKFDANAKNVEVNFTPSPCMIKGDQSELEIITNNLISNAIKYNKDGGKVDIKLGQSGKEIIFEVIDTGIGLSPEEQEKLFNEFTRIKNSDTMNIQGSGLGLSTVKKIAGIYGGDAKVTSKKGEGSTFSVIMSKES